MAYTNALSGMVRTRTAVERLLQLSCAGNGAPAPKSARQLPRLFVWQRQRGEVHGRVVQPPDGGQISSCAVALNPKPQTLAVARCLCPIVFGVCSCGPDFSAKRETNAK